MKNLYQIFSDSVDLSPEKVACICDTNQITYAQLNRNVITLADNLSALGLKFEDRIALFCPNSIDFAVVLLAAAKLGVAIAPLPVSLKGKALKGSLNKLNCKVVISWHNITKRLLEDGFDIHLLINIGRPIAEEHQLNDLIDQSITKQHKIRIDKQVPIDTDYILTLTSGSTGEPKPIVFSQKTKIDRALLATANVYHLTQDDIVLVATPLYHSLAQRSLILPLLLGGTVIILPKFSIKSWINSVVEHKVSFLFAVSSQLTSLLPNLKPEHDLSSLRCVVSSSAVLSDESKSLLVKRFPCQLHECYGASELGVVSDFCINNIKHKVGSVGKNLPFLSIKITDSNRNAIGVNSIGEISCISPTQFKGYFLEPVKTSAAYDDDGYFYTGDLGYLDEDGFLFYVGRLKDTISSGGINIYPQDIECVINSLDFIDECMAFGVINSQFGEVIKVVFTSSIKVELLSIRKACLAELTDYQQPMYIEQITEFPKSSLGKLLRQNVRELYT